VHGSGGRGARVAGWENGVNGSGPQDELFALLAPQRLTAVVDIGANPIDGDPPYKPMLDKGLCTVIGVEPQPDALKRLAERKGPREIYLPHVVGDGGTHTLHVCAASGMTSLFTPDGDALRHFRDFVEWGRVVHREEVKTIRLDDIAEVTELDFLKIDAQGSELSVFRGGRERLGRAVAVQVEVSFICLYENQPTFGDIDAELRGLGFVPHTFAAINRRMILPLETEDRYAALNQLLEADAVYVRDFTKPQRMSDEQLKHLALVSHHAYRSYDLACNCLFHLTARKAIAPASAERYLAMIKKTPSR